MDDTAWSLGGSQGWSLGAPPAYKSRPEVRAPTRPAISPPAPLPAPVPSQTAVTAAPSTGSAARVATLVAPPPPRAAPTPTPTKKKNKKKKRSTRTYLSAPPPNSPCSLPHGSVVTLRFIATPKDQDGPLVEAEGPEGVMSFLKNGDHTFAVDDFDLYPADLPELIRDSLEAGYKLMWRRLPGSPDEPDEWEVVIDPGGNP